MNYIQNLFSNHIKKFIRFGVVGVVNTAVDLLIFSWLYYSLGFAILPAHISGFCVAVINSFVMNSLWTFKQNTQYKQGSLVVKAALFFVVAAIGLIISSAVLLFLAPLMHLMAAKIVAIAVTLLWNYSASWILVFKR